MSSFLIVEKEENEKIVQLNSDIINISMSNK